MIIVNDRITIPESELAVDFARSGGPGGQNVNKVASKAILRWNPRTSESLPEAVRARLLSALSNRLTNDGDLIITSQRTRDQSRNLEDCREKLRLFVLDAANPPRPRRPTRPTLASRRRRVEAKARRSQTKQGRRGPSLDD
jgi:ribosome-associated protein